MKKIFKCLAVTLTLAFALCLSIFASACNDAEATDFTITVLYPDGSPVDGTKDGGDRYDGNVIKVQFCNADDLNSCWMTLPNLGADGKLTQPISEIKESPVFANVENFSLHILNLPEQYEYDEDIVLNSKNASATITLRLKTN